MHRSPRPFHSFQPAYTILSPRFVTSDSFDSTPFATRNRPAPDADSIDIDLEGQEPGEPRPTAAAMRISRPQSPSALTSCAIPLVQLGGVDDANWKLNGHTLLSRTPSPYPGLERGNGDGNLNGQTGSITKARGAAGKDTFGSWFKRGKFGWWLWSTQRGWVSLVTALVVLNLTGGVLLVLQNQFILRTGVYKFPFAITTTLLELLVVQFLLILTAPLTRSFSGILHSLGLSHLIAPPPLSTKPISKWSSPSLLSDWTSTGIFGLNPTLAKKALPLATISTLHLILSNLSFAFTLRPIYQLSRLSTLPLTLLFTYFWAYNNPLITVSTLSSTLTLTFAIIMVSINPPFLFTWEGVVAGIFSSIFAAAYPVSLLSTYKSFLEYHQHYHNSHEETLLGTLPLHRDSLSSPRAHWSLLSYITTLSIILTIPWVFISGEFGNINRNCYILDVPWFWLMILLGGLASFCVMVGGWMLVKTTCSLTAGVVGAVGVTVQSVLLGAGGLPEWGWTGAVTGWAAGGWYALGRRRGGGFPSWGGGEAEVVERGGSLWDGEAEEEEWLVGEN